MHFITPSLQVSVTIVLPVNLITVLQIQQTTRLLPSFPSFFKNPNFTLIGVLWAMSLLLNIVFDESLQA